MLAIVNPGIKLPKAIVKNLSIGSVTRKTPIKFVTNKIMKQIKDAAKFI